jgi:hypothetical protein
MLRAVVLRCVLLCVSSSTPAFAQEVRGIVHQRVVGLVNPLGAEHMLHAGVRLPIGDPSELIFTNAHFEAGVSSYTSPIYTMNGGYVQLSPVALIVLRAELSGVAMWPLGEDGAGHFALDRYEAQLDSGALDSVHALEAHGWNAQLSMTLQGAVPIGPARVLMWSQLVLEHQQLGSAPYYFSPRYDLVLAREDTMLASSSMVLLEIPLADGVDLRAGAYDDLRYVLGSEYLANQAGPLVALTLTRVDPAVPEVTVFARAGAYTNGRREGNWTGLVGVILRYDLGAIR